MSLTALSQLDLKGPTYKGRRRQGGERDGKR